LTNTLNNLQNKLDMKIGDYIVFGSYYIEPILWRVIHLDEDGDPMILSDKILCLKAFDEERRNKKPSCSNEWEASNIRYWLNSYELSIDWMQNSPLKHFKDPYNNEKGFLADGNFTLEERSLIKLITHKVLLANDYKHKKNGGTKPLTCNVHIAKVVQNYDTAHYKNVEDKVFFLSIKELHEYLYKNGWEYRAKPTAKALENTIWKHQELDSSKYWTTWLRTPFVTDSSFMRYVSYSGHIRHRQGCDGFNGVRPALFLNKSSVNIKHGSGIATDPFVIQYFG